MQKPTFISMRVPTNWSDITIKEFFKVNDIFKSKEDPMEKEMQVMSLIGRTNRAVVDKINIVQFKKIYAKFKFLEDIESLVKNKPKRYFWLKGTLYKTHFDIKKFKAEEWMDIMNYGKDAEKHLLNMHKSLAVHCKPVLSFRKDRVKRAKVFEESMTVGTAYPIFVFFYKVWQGSMPHIRIYLDGLMKENQKSLEKVVSDMKGLIDEKHLKSIGDGLSRLTRLATLTQRSGIKS